MIVCLGEENALMLNERMKAAIQHAAEHGGIDRMVYLGFEQLHVDRDWELVGYNLTRFVPHGSAVQIDANALAI